LILNEFARRGLRTSLVTPRAKAAVHPDIRVSRVVPAAVKRLPWRVISGFGRQQLQRRFAQEIDLADPAKSVLYFWPGASLDLLAHAKKRGFLLTREMINNPCAVAKEILDREYQRRGYPEYPYITNDHAEYEVEELKFFDMVFASNAEVEEGLAAVGVPRQKVRSVAFGFDVNAPWETTDYRRERQKPRFLFLGRLEIRKGLLDLLEAWEAASLDAELILAGHVDPAVSASLRRASASGSVRHLGFVNEVWKLLQDADVFVFPTLEEGGPQVTSEAAAAGLPIITTPMGAARLVEDQVTGLIVPPANPSVLAAALRALATDPARREALGRAAQRISRSFSYEEVAMQRAEALLGLARERLGRSA
jgi:glycosyltransferase involved in cell wall biosynthesis